MYKHAYFKAQVVAYATFKTDIFDVAIYILEQVQQPGYQSGYRVMHQKCIAKGYTVSRQNVAALMSILDPEGVQLRLRHRLRRRVYFANGPNFLWHIDSYDKLKRFGLCINGCIDGYSRNIIWVKATYSSSDPKIIAGHFIDAVCGLGGSPLKVRGDMGTENGHVAEMQRFLTPNGTFIYGKSTGNQRIEMFWRHLRNGCCQRWIVQMQYMVDQDLFDGGKLDINLVQHVFMHLLQVCNEKIKCKCSNLLNENVKIYMLTQNVLS